jgi:T-complex protein 1 subunit beta
MFPLLFSLSLSLSLFLSYSLSLSDPLSDPLSLSPSLSLSLSEGFVLNKSFGVGQPRRVENAKIMIANTPMDTDKIKIYGSRVRVDSMSKVAEIEEAEKQKMRNKCEKIIGHGISCFINRQLIYNFPEQIFTEAGVVSIEHADFDGIERLAAVTGGEIASTFDRPDLSTLGECALIDEIMVGEDKLIRFSGYSYRVRVILLAANRPFSNKLYL